MAISIYEYKCVSLDPPVHAENAAEGFAEAERRVKDHPLAKLYNQVAAEIFWEHWRKK